MPIRPPSRPAPAGTGYDSNLRADGLRTDYWNWGKGFISAYPPDQFIMLEQGATYGTQNSQIWTSYYTPCTRFSPACSIATRSAATRRLWKSPKTWEPGSMPVSKSSRHKRASACGTVISPASTAA